ncbi:MAG: peroxidase family protein, partial [Pseudomonadota bacterium]
MFSLFPYGVLGALFTVVEAIPGLSGVVNRLLINAIVSRARTRPHPFSTVHEYTSWRSLTDREWSGRHLPADQRPSYPDETALLAMFRRPPGERRLCRKSTCLFPAFAQYLTDGFLRTVSDDQVPDRLKRNTSNHQIDLSPLYGRTHEQTLALRVLSEAPGEKGRMKSQMICDEEFAPFLYAGGKVKPEFDMLDHPLGLSDLPPGAPHFDRLFAFGGDRANSVPQVSMMNTLFLREHNRIAGELETREPGWDDDRVFETARNIVIVLFIKIVVEEYINHIAPIPFNLRADPSVAWKAEWNKPNWITTEFSLLYRWHALIPDDITWGGQSRPVRETFLNNAPLIEGGLAQGFADMSAQRAGELGPLNTTESLLHVELASIRQGRDTSLASFSDYRRYISGKRPIGFEDVSSDPRVVDVLKSVYDEVEDVEFFPGIFAEDRVPNSPLPRTILSMVALDAFSQALTNPLLSQHVFNPRTFSRYGWKLIQETSTLSDILAR